MVGLRRTISTERTRAEEPLRLELAPRVERALAAGELSSVLPAQMLADVFLLNVFAALMAWAPSGEPSLGVVMPGVIDLFLRGAEGFGAPARRRQKEEKDASRRKTLTAIAHKRMRNTEKVRSRSFDGEIREREPEVVHSVC